MIRDSISTEYKDRVAEKLKAFFSLEPWYVRNISTHPLSIKVTGWLNSVSFTSLIAVTDMFFVRFRNHLFSGARIATLVSRMKGAAALTSLIDLRNSTDLEFGTLLGYFQITEMRPEIERIVRDEDQDNQFSYTPYLKDLGLCNVSPYSATANPRLYTMIHVIGSVIGFKRSWNARSVGDEGWLSIVEAAIVAGLMIGRNRSYKKLVTTTLAEGEA